MPCFVFIYVGVGNVVIGTSRKEVLISSITYDFPASVLFPFVNQLNTIRRKRNGTKNGLSS